MQSSLALNRNMFSFRISKKIFTAENMLLFLAICEKNIVRYFFLLFSMIPIIGGIADFVLHFIYLILIFHCWHKRAFRLSNVPAMLFLILSILAIGISAIVYPINSTFIFEKNNFWNTIFPCFKYFLIGLVLNWNEDSLKLSAILSCIGLLLETLYLFFYMIPNGLLSTDDMSRAYQILPNILIIICWAFNKKNIVMWLFVFLGTLYELSMGTRGPLVILFAYFFIKFIQTSSKKLRIKFIVLVFLAAIVFIFLTTDVFKAILETTGKLFSDLGLSTRILDFAKNGTTFSYMSGRDEIYVFAIDKIMENPYLGYGVYGEWQWFNWNAHNMYLEIFLHYGLLFGSIFLLWLIIMPIKTYLKSKNAEFKDIALIFFIFTFARGVFGGSYLMFGCFFLIGVCLRERLLIKKHQREKNYKKERIIW